MTWSPQSQSRIWDKATAERRYKFISVSFSFSSICGNHELTYLIFLVLNPFPPDMLLAKADLQNHDRLPDCHFYDGVDLAPQTRVLAVPVATLALQVLLLDDLAWSLVLELIVLEIQRADHEEIFNHHLTSQSGLKQKLQVKILPPWSQTPLSHSMQSASRSTQEHACWDRHFRLDSAQVNSKVCVMSTCDRPKPHKNHKWLPPWPFQLHRYLQARWMNV